MELMHNNNRHAAATFPSSHPVHDQYSVARSCDEVDEDHSPIAYASIEGALLPMSEHFHGPSHDPFNHSASAAMTNDPFNDTAAAIADHHLLSDDTLEDYDHDHDYDQDQDQSRSLEQVYSTRGYHASSSSVTMPMQMTMPKTMQMPTAAEEYEYQRDDDPQEDEEEGEEEEDEEEDEEDEEEEAGLNDLLSCGSVQAVANSMDLDQVM